MIRGLVMSRFLLLAVVLLAILGCARKAEPTFDTHPVHVAPTPQPETQPAAPTLDDGTIPPPRPVPVRSRMQALALGCDYLMITQKPDGSWVSDVYATF